MELQQTRLSPRTIVLVIHGHFNINQTEQVKKIWEDDIELCNIVVDLTGAELLDSAALAALVSGLKAMRQRDGNMVLASPSQAAQVLLELTRMDMVFPIAPDVDSAIKQLVHDAK